MPTLTPVASRPSSPTPSAALRDTRPATVPWGPARPDTPPPDLPSPGLPAPRSRRPSEASSGRESLHGSAGPRAPRRPAPVHLADDEDDPTDHMIGSFNPMSVPRDASVALVRRAPGGLDSIDEPTVPSFRAVNPYFFQRSAFHAKLPEDVQGCVAYVLSAMRRGDDDKAPLKALAEKQAAVLQANGIETREQFIDLLKKVEMRDRGTAYLHGMASSNGFNMGALVSDFWAAEPLLNWASEKMKDLPNEVPALVTGALLGLGLSAMDVGAGVAAEHTFADAYYLRPPAEQLPEPLHGANAHTKKSLAANLTIAAGASFGAARNGFVRIPHAALDGTYGTPKHLALGDNVSDVGGGVFLGAPGMRLARNSLDNGAGRAGFAHFLARDDLDACMKHLNSPAGEQALSAAKRFGDYLANVFKTLPEAAQAVLDNKTAWTSHAILGTGFGALFSMLVGMPDALKANGVAPEKALVYTQMAKFAVLQALYHVWGGALGAVAGPRAPAEPSQA